MTKLKHFRIKRRMTQSEVAAKLNITPRMYQYLEAGQRNPSWRVAIELEDLFKAPARDLLKKIS